MQVSDAIGYLIEHQWIPVLTAKNEKEPEKLYFLAYSNRSHAEEMVHRWYVGYVASDYYILDRFNRLTTALDALKARAELKDTDTGGINQC